MAWSYVGKTETTAGITSPYVLSEPAGVVAGDLLVATIAYRSSDAVEFATPAGWTKVNGVANASTATNTSAIASVGMWYCVRGASAPTFTFTKATGANVHQGVVTAYRGNLQSGVLGVTSVDTMAASGTAYPMPGVTTVAANSLLVVGIACGQESTYIGVSNAGAGSSSNPTDTGPPGPVYPMFRSNVVTTSGADVSVGVADKYYPTAGFTGDWGVNPSISARNACVMGEFKILPVSGSSVIAAMTAAGSTPSAGRQTIISAAVDGLVADGVMNKLKHIYVFAAESLIQAKVPWNLSGATVVSTGVDSFFVANKGFDKTGTPTNVSAFQVTGGGSQFDLVTTGSFGFYGNFTTLNGSGLYAFHTNGGSQLVTAALPIPANLQIQIVNSSGSVNLIGANAPPEVAHWTIGRGLPSGSSSSIRAYKNGAFYDQLTQAGSGTAGTVDLNWGAQAGLIVHVGYEAEVALTATDVSNLHARLTTYLTAIGALGPTTHVASSTQTASGSMAVTATVTRAATNLAPPTLNPADKNSNPVLSNGNLSITGNGAGGSVRTTTTAPAGALYYFEAKINAVSIEMGIGILNGTCPLDNYLGNKVGQHAYIYSTSQGSFGDNGTVVGFGGGSFAAAVNDVMMFAFNDTSYWVGRNGTWYNSSNPATNTGGRAHTLGANPKFVGAYAWDAADTQTMRFSLASQTYTVAGSVPLPETGWSATGSMTVTGNVPVTHQATNVVGGALNPANKGAAAVLSNNNLTLNSGVVSTYGTAFGTVPFTAGVGYFEAVQDSYATSDGVGLSLTSQATNTYIGSTASSIGYFPGLDLVYNNNSSTAVDPVTHGNGIVVGVYWNGTKAWFFANGVNVTGGDPALGTGGYTPVFNLSPIYGAASVYGTVGQFTFRFNPASWQYPPTFPVTPFFSGGWTSTGTMTATATVAKFISSTQSAAGNLTATVALSRGVNGTMASVSAMTVAAAVVRGVASTQSAASALTATAAVTRGASATLSSVSALTATAGAVRPIASTQSASGTMSVDAVVSNSGGYPINATLGAAGNMVVTANVTAAIASTQSAAGNMAVAGGRSQPIASTQSASGSMAVDGQVAKLVSATLSASGSLSATAAVTRGAASTQASVSAMTVTAQRQLNAAAAWAASGTMIAAAGFTQSGASTQSASGSMTVTAGVIRGAAVAWSAAGNMTGAISRSAGISATFGAAGSLTATVGRRLGVSAAFSAHGDMTVIGGVPVRASATLSAQATMWAEARVERLFYADTEVIEVPWDYRELTVPAEHINFTIDVGPSRAMTVAGGKRVDTQNRRNPRR